MGKLELYALAALMMLLAIAGAYFYGRHDGSSLERAKWESASVKAAEENMAALKTAINNSTAISQQTLDAVGKIKVTNRTINNEVRREITTDVRYAADCFPDSGRLLWNSINLGVVPSGATGGKPAPSVPGATGQPGSGQQGGNAPPKPR